MVLKFLSAVVITAFFVGCGASKYSIPSKSTEAQIVNNEKQSYVVFGTEELGAGRENPIFEYFPQSETFKLVTIITSHQKFIYPMPEGTHYFYSMGGETYDFVKVEATQGKKYFVNVETIFWTWRMTTPIEFEPTKDEDLIEQINTKMLIENSSKTREWFEARKDSAKFKAKVKIRFNDWKEDDMEDKTLLAKDGFPIK